jgi:hypothetical protein
MDEQSPGRVFYEGFQRAEFERWDGVIAEDVTINSPAGGEGPILDAPPPVNH